MEAEPRDKKPFIGIEDTDDRQGSGYSFKGNREGLVTLAIALLKGAAHATENKDTSVIALDVEDNISHDTHLFLPDYIELAEPPDKERKKPQAFFTFLSKIVSFLIGALLIVSLVVGLVVVFKWIF